MEEELVVQFSPESSEQPQGILPVRIVREIWREITFGVGTWGAPPVGYGSLAAFCSVPFSRAAFQSTTVGRLNGRSFKFRWRSRCCCGLDCICGPSLTPGAMLSAPWATLRARVDHVRRSNRRQDRPNPNGRRRQNRLADFQK